MDEPAERPIFNADSGEQARELLGEALERQLREALAPNGIVFVRGELWKAHTQGEALEPGTPVRIERIDYGLVLEVDPARVA